MLKDLIDQLSGRVPATHDFQRSIDRLCELGNEWENINKFTSYYIVQSHLANSASLMWGDIRYRTSYSSIITLFIDEDGRMKVSTVNFDTFQEESYEVTGIITNELIIRCLTSTYNKNIITSITSLSSIGDDKCKIQVRTGIFWSDMEISAADCKKIFSTLGSSPRSFKFGEEHERGNCAENDFLPYKFMKQINQVSVNGIKFKVRIRKDNIDFEILEENSSTLIFKGRT